MSSLPFHSGADQPLHTRIVSVNFPSIKTRARGKVEDLRSCADDFPLPAWDSALSWEALLLLEPAVFLAPILGRGCSVVTLFVTACKGYSKKIESHRMKVNL